jgi:hypothetical protein
MVTQMVLQISKDAAKQMAAFRCLGPWIARTSIIVWEVPIVEQMACVKIVVSAYPIQDTLARVPRDTRSNYYQTAVPHAPLMIAVGILVAQAALAQTFRSRVAQQAYTVVIVQMVIVM